MYKIKMM